MIKSKYTIIIMLKLIEAKRFGDRNTINIEGTVKVQRVVLREGKSEKIGRQHDSPASIKCEIKRLRVNTVIH